MREKILSRLAGWHANHPWRMLTVALVLTVIFGILSTRIGITMRWSDLLPADDRRTIQFNKIIEEFVTSTSIIVVVQGEEEQAKQFADKLAPRLLAAVDTSKNASLQKDIHKLNIEIAELVASEGTAVEIAKLRSEITSLEQQKNKKIVRRIDYKTEIDFLKKHGLMLIKEDDLKNIKDNFIDPNLTGLLFNINNSLEKEYVNREESISTREREDQAVIFLDGIQQLVRTMQRAALDDTVSESEARTTADKILFGEPYMLSYDKKALIMNVIPNFTMLDLHYVEVGTEIVQSIVDDLLLEFPGVKAGLTGMIPVGHDEMVYSQQSLGYTSLIAVIAILILLILSLRMWVAPLFAIINLIIGIIWAIGITAVVVGQLNMMTQMMAVILLGLGIDFSIHLISGFTERRAAGDSIAVALDETFKKSGKGILTGALTTAFAFLTLVISSSRGMKEMGLVTGLGLLAILLATFIFLPVMLVLRERRLEQKRQATGIDKSTIQRDISFRFLGVFGESLYQRPGLTLLGATIITGLLIWAGSKITFDHNYMNIEPEGLTSIVLQDTVMEKFDLSMDYALILTDNVAESRNLSKKYRELGSVAMSEDISLYLPSTEQQQKRIPLIQDIQQAMTSKRIQNSISSSDFLKLKQEVERLEMNIMEMQTMAFMGGQDKVDNKCTSIVGNQEEPDLPNIIHELQGTLAGDTRRVISGLSQLQRLFGPHFQESVIKMSSTDPIRITELPNSILDRYSNKTRDQFLITVFPAGNIWQDANFLDQFTDDLERISDRATGMPPVFRALVDIIGRDGRNALFLTLFIVFILLVIDFRSPRNALMAMIPLAVGIFWMVGFMYLAGMQFTVMNIMGLPMILGIGIDDGVHIVHRWVSEGKSKVQTVFSSTGKAILLTSLTTMIGFGSLVFSIWRGFAHLGGALFIGVGACFLTTVIILPGIMGLIEKK